MSECNNCINYLNEIEKLKNDNENLLKKNKELTYDNNFMLNDIDSLNEKCKLYNIILLKQNKEIENKEIEKEEIEEKEEEKLEYDDKIELSTIDIHKKFYINIIDGYDNNNEIENIKTSNNTSYIGELIYNRLKDILIEKVDIKEQLHYLFTTNNNSIVNILDIKPDIKKEELKKHYINLLKKYKQENNFLKVESIMKSSFDYYNNLQLEMVSNYISGIISSEMTKFEKNIKVKDENKELKKQLNTNRCIEDENKELKEKIEKIKDENIYYDKFNELYKKNNILNNDFNILNSNYMSIKSDIDLYKEDNILKDETINILNEKIKLCINNIDNMSSSQYLYFKGTSNLKIDDINIEFTNKTKKNDILDYIYNKFLIDNIIYKDEKKYLVYFNNKIFKPYKTNDTFYSKFIDYYTNIVVYLSKNPITNKFVLTTTQIKNFIINRYSNNNNWSFIKENINIYDSNNICDIMFKKFFIYDDKLKVNKRVLKYDCKKLVNNFLTTFNFTRDIDYNIFLNYLKENNYDKEIKNTYACIGYKNNNINNDNIDNDNIDIDNIDNDNIDINNDNIDNDINNDNIDIDNDNIDINNDNIIY